jgi:hypothetical protein
MFTYLCSIRHTVLCQITKPYCGETFLTDHVCSQDLPSSGYTIFEGTYSDTTPVPRECMQVHFPWLMYTMHHFPIILVHQL